MTTLVQLSTDLIAASLTNPRKTFNQAKLEELAESIKATGVHAPVLVRPLPGHRNDDTFRNRGDGKPLPTHELVVGERRLRATILAGLSEIPAIVRELTDAEAEEIQVVENLQRDDLSALEEAEGYEHLMERRGMVVDQVAQKIGKSTRYVYARLQLLKLQPGARKALSEGTIDPSRALLLARIPDASMQGEALKAITRTSFHGDRAMGVREATDYVQRHFMLKLAEAKFSRKADDLVPGAGACHSCPKRTGANPELFEDVKSADVCTDPKCYHAKEEAHSKRLRADAEQRGQTVIDGREAKALMPNSWSNRVEGYLRLDDASDSPTVKPLRTLIGKQMLAENVQPVLVANPHKGGELIAVLPADKVAELLKAKGNTKEAAKVTRELESNDCARKDAEKREAEIALENAWRWAVLEATWRKVQAESAGQSSGPKLDEVTRHMALRNAAGINQDNAKRLCKLLELGKVAPKDGLLDWIRTTPTPGAAMLLLVMFAEVEYRHWLDDEKANRGLFLVAEAFGVDKNAIEAQTRANTRAAKASAKKATKAPTTDAPAAQASGVRGSKVKKPAPAARAPKLAKTTPEEALQGIAAAMQSEESAAPAAEDPGAAGAAQGNEAAADVGRVDQAAAHTPPIAVGDRVRVVGNEMEGNEGTVRSITSKGVHLVYFNEGGSDFRFKADELETLPSKNAWPFPPTKASLITGAQA